MAKKWAPRRRKTKKELAHERELRKFWREQNKKRKKSQERKKKVMTIKVCVPRELLKQFRVKVKLVAE